MNCIYCIFFSVCRFYKPCYVVETSQRIHKKIQNIGIHKPWGCAIALISKCGLWCCMGRFKLTSVDKDLLLGLWFFLSPSLLGEGHRNLDTSDHYALGREKYLSFLHSSKCHNLASLLMGLESWPWSLQVRAGLCWASPLPRGDTE